MRKIHKIDSYLPLEDFIQDMVVDYRRKFGEPPVVGTTMDLLYDTWRRLGRPAISGGKGEPVSFSMLTFAGITTVFEDAACGPQECSVEEPDE